MEFGILDHLLLLDKFLLVINNKKITKQISSETFITNRVQLQTTRLFLL
jgi:hypothetical protein